MTLFGIGWSGGETSLGEVIWMWKGLIVFTLVTATAIIGLIGKKKFGVLLGYVVCLGLIGLPVFSFISMAIDDIEILQNSIFIILMSIILPAGLFIGLIKLQKVSEKFKKGEYVLGVVLTVILYLSFYFMFDIR